MSQQAYATASRNSVVGGYTSMFEASLQPIKRETIHIDKIRDGNIGLGTLVIHNKRPVEVLVEHEAHQHFAFTCNLLPYISS